MQNTAEVDKRKPDQGKLETSLPSLIIKDISYFHRLTESDYLGFFPVFSSHTVLKNSGRIFPPSHHTPKYWIQVLSQSHIYEFP